MKKNWPLPDANSAMGWNEASDADSTTSVP